MKLPDAERDRKRGKQTVEYMRHQGARVPFALILPLTLAVAERDRERGQQTVEYLRHLLRLRKDCR